MYDFPETSLDQAITLENILVAACEGAKDHDTMYREIRSALLADTALCALVPQFVRTCRDLNHLWGYIKSVSPKWEPRRHHVRDAMTPLIDHLEGANRAPIDAVASDVLQKFDADGVNSIWDKALARRYTDPDGAITTARTLLETVCKRVLDESGGTYSDKDDLPALYRAVAQQLQIAPSQHSEDAFRRILGGATSVVEGLGSLRNKIGDAHGQGRRPIRPTARHAQLAVNLAGAMATFIVDTWNDRQAESQG
jgi:Abortive infection C-terminus